MKTLATALAAFALFTAPGLAADPTGKWEATVSGPRGDMAYVFDLKADGEALSGVISNDFIGESEISDGNVSGDTVSFKQKMERGERVITFSYTGKVNGDEMELTRTVEGMGGGGGRKDGPRPGAGPGGPGGQRGGGMGREMTFTAKRVE